MGRYDPPWGSNARMDLVPCRGGDGRGCNPGRAHGLLRDPDQ